MSCKSSLAANHHVFSNFCTSANACLSRYYSIIPNFNIMCYLQKIIKLNASANNCTANCSPVNCTIGAYFHMVFYNYISNLRNFFVSAIGLRCKTKSIASNYGTCMYNHIRSNNTFMINFHTRMYGRIFSNSYPVTQICTRVYFCTISYNYIFSQIGKCTNKNIVSGFCSSMNVNRLLNSCQHLCFYLLILIQQNCKCRIGIWNTNQSCINSLF